MQRFYFDHNATTPIDAEVLEVAVSCLGQVYGNASSIHYFGQGAKQRLEVARRQIAALIRCHPAELVFTSGGTEADNMAVLGTVRAAAKPAAHVITSAIEHPAVLSACQQLEREGAAVTRVRVGSNGVVNPDDVRRALRPETVLVTIMHANNELGTLQP
ncbi:MAG TPA: aminotransferase class V-fold PLP-dependent enzyme, partial [Verrucomicrobiae bacterium]|nr:aminotransferase class V-fold PLP-dependent enzyme [Verrucomicrobiae bacterium]